MLFAAQQPLLGQLAPTLAVLIIVGGLVAIFVANPRLSETFKERNKDVRSFTGKPAEKPDEKNADGSAKDDDSTDSTGEQWWGSNFDMFRDTDKTSGP